MSERAADACVCGNATHVSVAAAPEFGAATAHSAQGRLKQ
jgi:hypothetical protein